MDEQYTNPTAQEEPGHIVVLTQQGMALMAKQQLGAPPIITRAVAGSGVLDPIDLEGLTEIPDILAEMQLGPRTLVDGSTVRLDLRLTSAEMDTTAMIRIIGVYAEDPDEGEILYQVVWYRYPQVLPSMDANYGAVATFDTQINLTFANGEVAVIPATPGWFLNQEDLDVHNRDPQAHLGAFARITGRVDDMEEEFQASQSAQDTRIKLLEDTLLTDIQDNKSIITFGSLAGIQLIQGVYNAALSRVEC